VVRKNIADVAIAGGGLVGATLAIALAQHNLTSIVIDCQHPDEATTGENDGRTTAVSYGSRQILEKLDIWEKINPHAEPIAHINIFQQSSLSETPTTPWAVYFNPEDTGNLPIGYMVENSVLRKALVDTARTISAIQWIAPAQINHTRRNAEGVVAELTDGRCFETSLIVGAEGRLSPVREEAGLAIRQWDYAQMALVAHIFHEHPHQGTAWEIFQVQGPFAVLPLPDCPQSGRHCSGIVWTGSPARMEELLKLNNEDLSGELEKIFPYYGSPCFSGKRWIYPLSAMIAKKCIGHRLAIIGDAAHVVHPVGGQGVNLGWRDARDLASVLAKAKKFGLDLGGEEQLKTYQQLRRRDVLSVLAMTDGLVRLFSHTSGILHFLCSAGLGTVNQLSFIKRRLVRKVMGI
jgi:2-octaprenyl-6-methoxyphenol hydroxylase